MKLFAIGDLHLSADGNKPMDMFGAKWEHHFEKISTDWVRLNLRPAMAQGMTADEIAWYLVRSAEWGALSFTRQNVYNFCVKIDGSERMRAAAAMALDEQWLPGHSEQYREAYHPAYRVLHKDFRKFGQSHKLMKLASDRGDNANDA